MTAPSSWRLGVDLGTSTTIAMLQWPDGRVRPLLFDGSPLLSSAVLLGTDGRLYTGRDAAHLSRGTPDRLEPNPKRQIDDGTVLLGGAEVPVVDLLAAVLRRVAVEAGRVAGQLGEVTLTHPATWGTRRRGLLVEAAQRAGLGQPRLVAEPDAAAMYLARTRGDALPLGGHVLVYDLGAGTCDVTLLRRTQWGLEMIATGGLNDVGGLDIDAAIIAFLEASYGKLWTDLAGRRQLWDEVRTAKEMLSRASSTVIAVPALGKEVPLGREQLDGLARPVLRSTIAVTKALLRDAGDIDAAATALFLVGGASRVPLVAALLFEGLGIAPIVTEQPELVVAEGALYNAPAPSPAAFGSPATVSGPPVAVSGPPLAVSGPPLAGAAPVPSPTLLAPLAVPPLALPPLAGPARRGSRTRTAVLASGIAVAAVLGLGTAGYLLVNRTRSGVPAATSSTHGAPGAGAGTGPARSHQATASTSAVKYTATRLPKNLCPTVDLAGLARTFPTQSTAPVNQSNLSTAASTFSCILSRQRGTGNALVTASVVLTAIVFADTTFAVTTIRSYHDNAALNDPNLATLSGIGDEAFVYHQPVDSSSAATNANDWLYARDGNLVWQVQLNANSSGRAWTDAERTQLRDDLVAAMRATQANLPAG